MAFIIDTELVELLARRMDTAAENATVDSSQVQTGLNLAQFDSPAPSQLNGLAESYRITAGILRVVTGEFEELEAELIAELTGLDPELVELRLALLADAGITEIDEVLANLIDLGAGLDDPEDIRDLIPSLPPEGENPELDDALDRLDAETLQEFLVDGVITIDSPQERADLEVVADALTGGEGVEIPTEFDDDGNVVATEVVPVTELSDDELAVVATVGFAAGNVARQITADIPVVFDLDLSDPAGPVTPEAAIIPAAAPTAPGPGVTPPGAVVAAAIVDPGFDPNTATEQEIVDEIDRLQREADAARDRNEALEIIRDTVKINAPKVGGVAGQALGSAIGAGIGVATGNPALAAVGAFVGGRIGNLVGTAGGKVGADALAGQIDAEVAESAAEADAAEARADELRDLLSEPQEPGGGDGPGDPENGDGGGGPGDGPPQNGPPNLPNDPPPGTPQLPQDPDLPSPPLPSPPRPEVPEDDPPDFPNDPPPGTPPENNFPNDPPPGTPPPDDNDPPDFPNDPPPGTPPENEPAPVDPVTPIAGDDPPEDDPVAGPGTGVGGPEISVPEDPDPPENNPPEQEPGENNGSEIGDPGGPGNNDDIGGGPQGDDGIGP